ncbi:aspartate aminotransferase family protein [bacterium]
MPYRKKENKFMLNVYKRYPICITRAKGMYMWDINNKKYLDFISGIAVNAFGHCHPKITQIIKKQAEKLVHVSNLFYTNEQISLAEKLIELYGAAGKVFLSNSGTEANECAIKLARKWGQMQNKNKFEIISFKQSFHGRTIASLSATGQDKLQKDFKPLLKGFKYAAFNDIESVKKIINSKSCAVIVESIQGEGGVNIAEKSFLKSLASLCKKNKTLLILDEIQMGLGRTGKMFGYEHFGIKPDMVTLAKALGNGLPIGATIVSNKISGTFSYGSHGSTFGGNLVACACAKTILAMLTDKQLKHNENMGKYLNEKLNKLNEKYKFITEIRGKGLVWGMDLKKIDVNEIVDKCREQGLCISAVQGKSLRFLPAYIVTKKEINKLFDILDGVFKTIK